jgi:hypothetical protein
MHLITGKCDAQGYICHFNWIHIKVELFSMEHVINVLQLVQRGEFFYYRPAHKVNDIVIQINVHFGPWLTGSDQLPELDVVAENKIALL